MVFEQTLWVQRKSNSKNKRWLTLSQWVKLYASNEIATAISLQKKNGEENTTWRRHPEVTYRDSAIQFHVLIQENQVDNYGLIIKPSIDSRGELDMGKDGTAESVIPFMDKVREVARGGQTFSSDLFPPAFSPGNDAGMAVKADTSPTPLLLSHLLLLLLLLVVVVNNKKMEEQVPFLLKLI